MAIRNGMRALAVAGAVMSGQAMADVQAHATVGNLRVSLFDLDLTDAVTPSLVFSVPPTVYREPDPGRIVLHYQNFSTGSSESVTRHVTAVPGMPASLAYSHGDHAAVDATLGHPSPAPETQVLSVSTRLGPGGNVETQSSGRVYADDVEFTLSPNTRASFSIELAVNGSTTPSASHLQNLEAFATFLVGGHDASDLAGDYALFGIGTYFDTPLAMDDTAVISVDFSNATGAERYGFLSFSAGATAWLTPVSAVPEAASWAMLPVGAILLGRRLQRTRRPAH
ncbi:hypothetical protein [Massilia alkalitolerans]|uniref:hypothetical protein n=1 Tax=Massilia alkalitolerans TaxID=286638 RepID=UPI000426A2F2|nr:hypothetical protein [Massilia alkalitolerans]